MTKKRGTTKVWSNARWLAEAEQAVKLATAAGEAASIAASTAVIKARLKDMLDRCYGNDHEAKRRFWNSFLAED